MREIQNFLPAPWEGDESDGLFVTLMRQLRITPIEVSVGLEADRPTLTSDSGLRAVFRTDFRPSDEVWFILLDYKGVPHLAGTVPLDQVTQIHVLLVEQGHCPPLDAAPGEGRHYPVLSLLETGHFTVWSWELLVQ